MADEFDWAAIEKAAQEAERLAKGFAGIIAIAPVLKSMSAAKRALDEMTQHRENLAQEIETDIDRLADLKRQTTDEEERGRTAAGKIIAEAETKAAGMIAEAEAKIDRLVDDRYAVRLSDLQGQVQTADNRATEAERQAAANGDLYTKAKAKITELTDKLNELRRSIGKLTEDSADG